MRSLFASVLDKVSVYPQAASAEVDGSAVDTQGYNTAMAIITNGAATGSPTSYTVDAKVQTCDTTNGTWADVTGAAITQITADNKSAQIRVDNVTSLKKYLRVMVTPAMTGGTTPKALISARILLGRGYQEPVGNSTTGA
jgi:Flp pilus assembly protein TadG